MKTKFLSLLMLCILHLAFSTNLWASNVITYTANAKISASSDAFNVSISSHTFSNGQGTITFSGEVTSIGESAFSGCSGLTSITIPNSVTSIGDYAFSRCSSLTSITIPNSVTSIGDYAFYGCSNLKVVYNDSQLNIQKGSKNNGYVAYYADRVYNGIPEGDFVIKSDTILIAYIGQANNVTIPNKITSIGEGAFYGCSGLTSITIPNSVTSIGNQAFSGCSGLRTITCYAVTPPTAAEATFEGVSQYTKTYVLASSLEDYQFAIGWRNLNLLPIGGTETPITKDDVTVTPSTDNATFTWPVTDAADCYTLQITKDGVVFCSLKFNAQGQLIGIAFAPGINGNHRAPAAVMTTNGWQFTVTGLNQASKYTYKMDVTDAAKQVIKSYKGEFATDGYTDLLTLPYKENASGLNKFIQNGQLYILRDGILYDARGVRIE